MPWPVRSVIRSAMIPLAKKCRRVGDMMMVDNRTWLEPRDSLLTKESLDTHGVGAPASLVKRSDLLPKRARIAHDCRRQVGPLPGVTARKPPCELGEMHATLPRSPMSVFDGAAHERMPVIMGSHQPRKGFTMHPAVRICEDEYVTACQSGRTITRLVRQQAYRALLETNLGKASANHVARLL